MTDIDQPPRGERFGAATPGARATVPSLEDLLTTSSTKKRGLTWRRILAFIGVLIVGVAGYAAGWFTAPNAGPQLSQLAVTATALPAGSKLVTADLKVVSVKPGAQVPSGALSPAAASGLRGLVTQSPLPAGTFLTSALFGPAGAVPNAAQALVGLALKPGQMPSGGLSTGQQVDVIELPTSSGGTPLTPVPLVTTSVWYLQGPDTSGNMTVTVVVPAFMASHLAGFASRGEVALVTTNRPHGTPSSSPSTSSTKSTPSSRSKGKSTHIAKHGH